uniref:(northern house mosquito) hypothetical protein n=1 Tax=Culex pipiens TaxID=7175 RepID=A0A8D8CA68_CULPI
MFSNLIFFGSLLRTLSAARWQPLPAPCLAHTQTHVFFRDKWWRVPPFCREFTQTLLFFSGWLQPVAIGPLSSAQRGPLTFRQRYRSVVLQDTNTARNTRNGRGMEEALILIRRNAVSSNPSRFRTFFAETS